MATCSPSTLLSANPFVGLSDGQKLAAECELIRQWAGSSETVSQILARAWDFKNLSEGTALAVEAGLLAEIAVESNPYVLLHNNGFVSLDSGLVWSAKLARLRELAGDSGDIDPLFLNNHFESIDQGLARSAKLRLLCDLAYGVGSGSASQALSFNPFWVMSEGLIKACINELLCLSSSSATIETVVTQSSVTPSETLSVSGGYDAVRVWTGETPSTEPWFFLYVTRSGVTSKIKMNRWEARVINVPGGSIGFGTSDGRTIYVAKDVKASALGTSFPVSGTANADRAGVPIWTPSAPHITLPAGERQYELVGSGTERIVFVSEYDGTTWSPARWLRLPASGSVRLHATFSQIALANYDGATVSVNGPTGTVIGGTSASASLTFPAVTGTTHNVSTVAQLKTAIGASVAGDEIVLAAGTYALDVNITAASFTANNGVGGRVGMEGITIRGATADRTLYVIGVSGGAGDWDVAGNQPNLIAGFKDLTFNFGSTSANFTVNGGRWNLQNVAWTGSTTTNVAFRATTTNVQQVMALGCDSSNAGVDCYDYLEGKSNSYCKLINCTGSTAGPLISDQVLTCHNSGILEVYGGTFSDANLNVIAMGSGGRAFMAFCTVTKGARKGAIQRTMCFGITNRTTGQAANGWTTSGQIGFVIASVTSNQITETGTTIVMDFEGNLSVSESGGEWYYPYNVVSGFKMERNVVVGHSIGLRFNFGTTGSAAANRNTIIGGSQSCDISTATWAKTLQGNVSKDASTRGITSNVAGMGVATVDYNIWCGTPSASYVPGANDVTGVNAALDANYLPTAGGNCDGTGNPAAIDWVGGTDYVGFLLEISSVTRDRGARCRPRIIANAELTPDIW